MADDKNQQHAVHHRRQKFVPAPYITDDKKLSVCRTSPTTSFPAHPLRQMAEFCRKPYFADNFPYIADDKPYIADDKPYIADI
ncbi:MAG: hypothetical protein LCH99_35265 [Proteobacteria bacterium]|nr:hypothetical protein [Pseudomonadota bacterium]